ncbi:hypothetical protein [Saccharothrix syringae]|uniref:Uncharacterized protein n=1 Tax=Saccharothrix syringae TaxID=103733 RepID=A0A5Q0H2C5_SACSY|nr:hypothetical protein [Saccharothrix syringae]QFZ19842.1 hypothetical protein EKG83_22580 [Saccharothrix syringae]
MILAGRVVGPLLPPGLPTVVIAVVVACLTTRWAAPALLRAAAWLLRTAVAATAVLLVLPDYCWSTRSRRDDRTPSPVVYAYGDGVGCVASWLDRLVRFALGLAARVVRALPLPLVGTLAALFVAASALGLVTVW